MLNLLISSLQFCLALGYFATGSDYNDVAASQGVTKGLVSTCVAKVSDFLHSIRDIHIRFPIHREQQARRSRAYFEKRGHPGCLGGVDGTHIAIISPRENEPAFINRKQYNGKCFSLFNFFFLIIGRLCRKRQVCTSNQGKKILKIYHLEWTKNARNSIINSLVSLVTLRIIPYSISKFITQVIVDADYLFLHVDPRWPGSVHDAHCMNMSDVLEAGNGGQLEDYFILGDSA